ncbi:ABC transporter ATP-binding protein [uncultured Methanobrevibacter sp.]|uniref:ABC transporter ATP-binding protein n=1 Tax=uncultured Methanobrevibacter sp. TaxID=253161 RepID=UPI00260C9289|nr:ABC transporter ATP-binding protein [uncultured Methanobrevibacter sp.]
MKKKNLKFKSNIDIDSNSVRNNQIRNQENTQYNPNYQNDNHRKQPKEIIFNSQENYEIPNISMEPRTVNSKPQLDENKKEEIPIKTNIDENKNYEKEHQDVDNLISQFVPEYQENIAIELKDVSLSFKISNDKIDNLKEYVIRTIKRNKEKSKKFKALDKVSFKIYQGEKVGVIGFNGAGKSTLLKIVSGVYDCDEGEVHTNGIIAPLLSLGAGFDYNYSGRDNIYLNGAILGYTEDFLKSKYDEIVEFSELQEFINFPVKNYSSGMLAKLGFSIATVVNPDILIIDEILSVGDVKFQKKSNDKIKSLMGSGTTVLLVSHSIQQIRNLCDKALWINKGKVVAFDEVNKVCDAYLKAAENASKDQLKNIKLN